MTKKMDEDEVDYSKISGYVPEKLASRFRTACENKQLSYSEALEEVVKNWLNNHEALNIESED